MDRVEKPNFKVTEKVRIEKRIIGQKFWWDKEYTREKRKLGSRTGNGEKEKVIETDTSN